jgi:uncharacterized protein
MVGQSRQKSQIQRFSAVVTLAEVDVTLLKAQNIRGIILDLDNTIVAEDDTCLAPGAEAWIATLQAAGWQFFILSNGKRRYRVDYWSDRLHIPAFSPAQKPFPRNFRRALKRLALPPEQVVVIGDSWHTDLLGARLVGCHSLQVASLPHPPRWWEKVAGRWLQKPYPKNRELWSFSAAAYNQTSPRP